MTLPSADTPLYNHPLPQIESWLTQHGCQQDSEDVHCWLIEKLEWRAELCLDVDQINIRYIQDDGPDIQRSFKYSLSRQDLEDAIFAGP
ncbi:DUF3143 domain-containing protein [Phormidesmis priestleyi ULC007]|uniref:DUF3143 domain-containing protein n=1 Tax=Phormidesmis priestleyi ULC007 TaxID=1920490 RepID=A0A2T1DM36_9CYAN|nr:DUF3143 domain-containing protein [Phormidesmis priestleyi]PSB21521.1 DUF3143 domain-containing protein [Phormidesmis priestleyi ULC007]PZO54561.1 MAG: DUF3143 domain-containing protein [Phormidesmis priestleyi]